VLKLAIPLLQVSNCESAEMLYCNQLGFQREFAHRLDGGDSGPCYMGVKRDGVWLHLPSFSGDGVPGGVANLIVEGVDSLHAEFVRKGVEIAVGPVDQTWGTRQMYVKDVDGNCLRFIQPWSCPCRFSFLPQSFVFLLRFIGIIGSCGFLTETM
jgi:Glyoxalase superfamily protein